MKKISFILLTFILFAMFSIATPVFAADEMTINSVEDLMTKGLPIAIGIELFCSIHMSVFVLMPLAEIINKSKKNTMFCILFLIRLVILIIGDIFMPLPMMMLDFISVFIFAFVVIPVFRGVQHERGKTGSKMNDFTEVLDAEISNIGYNDRKEFEKMLVNRFLEAQEAYSKQDLEKLNTLCTRAKYDSYSTEIRRLEKAKQKKTRTDIKVSKLKVYDVYLYESKEVSASIVAPITYTENVIDQNGNTISSQKLSGLYTLKFTKNISESEEVINCSNCGAPITNHTSSKCEYCGCLIHKQNREFVLQKVVRIN